MSPLISANDLGVLLTAGAVAVLDVRWRLRGPSAKDAYDEGHVPGAVFVDLDTDLARPADEHGRHPLPAAADFEHAMRRCGVNSDRPVVCYDFADATSAARAWWLLRYFGHVDVRVLDGGYAAWVAGCGQVSAEQVTPARGDFVASPGHLPLLDADNAAALAREGVLLDARATERYAGTEEPVDLVAGHIPGAVSAPTLANAEVTGRFRRAEALRERFERLGVEQGTAVGSYCGSGVTAAHEVLALEVAGFSAALYADSWSGWITDTSRPVATGDEPG